MWLPGCCCAVVRVLYMLSRVLLFDFHNVLCYQCVAIRLLGFSMFECVSNVCVCVIQSADKYNIESSYYLFLNP